MGYGRDRELFKTHNGGAFDPLAMAETAIDNNLTFLLHHHRLARIGEQHALYDNMLSLTGYLASINGHLAGILAATDNDYHQQIAEIGQKRFVAHLIQAAANESASEQVRAGALLELKRSSALSGKEAESNAHQLNIVREINNFLADPTSVKVAPAPSLPDGSPIGCGEMH